MTENWQAEPSPWLSPGHEQPGQPGAGAGVGSGAVPGVGSGAGPQAADPTAPQGLQPLRLHVNGDVVSIGPPMVDPPRLTPVSGPVTGPVPGPVPGSGAAPIEVSVPQIAAPLDIDEPYYAPQQYTPPPPYVSPPQFAEPQHSVPAEIPPPPPYVNGSAYGSAPYSQPQYSDTPYAVAYTDKPLDNQPYLGAPVPPPYSEPLYLESTSLDFDPLTSPLPVSYYPVAAGPSEPQNSSHLTPVPHPSYQQRPIPPVAPPVAPPLVPPLAPPPPATPALDADPFIGGTDTNATMMVAVGTVQPRAPQPVATVEDAERVLGAAVDSLDADPDLYSIGSVTDGAVCLIPDDGRWTVFLADGGQRRFAGSFEDPMMAAVHFAGVLLLAAGERGALPKASPSQPRDEPAGQSSDPLAEFLAGPPITPLAGDPPTTLYTEHRLTALSPGTEVDRYGDQLGNTVYAARTRYPHRSLPPDYIEREYRVYRVRDPLRALAGTAIPWFGQPGGGTAYLLPRPIADLLREGVLVEIPASTVAPD